MGIEPEVHMIIVLMMGHVLRGIEMSKSDTVDCPKDDCDGEMEKFITTSDETYSCDTCGLIPEWSDKDYKKPSHIGQCFITTAVSDDDYTLQPLRGFRDDVMRPQAIGRFLLYIYYTVSPPVAETLRDNPDKLLTNIIRSLVRRCSSIARWRENTGPVRSAVTSIILVLLYLVVVSIGVVAHLMRKAEVATNAFCRH